MTWYHCTFLVVWISFSQATVRCFFIQFTAITSPPWNAVAVSFCGTEFRKARISYVSRFCHTEMNVLSECENETHSVIAKRYKKKKILCVVGMCHSTTVPACGRESSLISFINNFPSQRVRYVCIVWNTAEWTHMKSQSITKDCILPMCALLKVISDMAGIFQ